MGLVKKSVLRVEPLEDRSVPSADVVLEWNQLALNAIRQTNMNPLLASRALAITQTAVYDSVNSIDRSYEAYFADVHASRGASIEAAAAQAAHDTLAALFPSQANTFDTALAADLVGIAPGRARQGIEVGQAVAQQILTWRSTDGSGALVPYVPGTDPGDWQPTPPLNLPALGPQWPDVTPFAMSDGSQFRPGAPPALDSAEYTAAFNEVKDLGRVDSTTRTAEQTQIALFWKDAAGTSYAFGHWNLIAQGVATDQGLSVVSEARLFALLNIATADAIISCWDAKYTYNLWRPVTAIRAAGTDGNPDTAPDAGWTPLIVTPNFPSYTSAHSTVSGAAAGVLTALFGDDYHFTVGSEGLTGVTRSFTSFDAAAAEAGRSRIYGGIHYSFDSTTGLEVGANLATYVMGGFLKPRDAGGAEESGDAGPTGGATPGVPHGVFDGHGGVVASGPVTVRGFRTVGYDPGLLTQVGRRLVNDQAPSGAGLVRGDVRGDASDNGLKATAPVVNPTTYDGRTSGGAVPERGVGSGTPVAQGGAAWADLDAVFADFASTNQADVLGDRGRL
jgi:membrane-associated phospholipid phosphatase